MNGAFSFETNDILDSPPPALYYGIFESGLFDVRDLDTFKHFGQSQSIEFYRGMVAASRVLVGFVTGLKDLEELAEALADLAMSASFLAWREEKQRGVPRTEERMEKHRERVQTARAQDLLTFFIGNKYFESNDLADWCTDMPPNKFFKWHLFPASGRTPQFTFLEVSKEEYERNKV